ncbi:MAG: T9SS type A sorting domain-containing protein [Bacteroidales bacterium]|nr:T9SS type A sorting domain-containing protein [Bacteroidales bacterium]
MKKIKLFLLIFISIIWGSISGFSQKSYEMELLNLVQHNETEYRFDVRMRNTSANPSSTGAFAIEGIQWQLLYNTARLNGGALNNNYLTYVSNTTDLTGTAIVPESSRFTTDQTIMQWLTAALDIDGKTTLFNDGTWKRIGTFKVILRDVSTNPGSVAKNWSDGLLDLVFNGSANMIVTECNYYEENGSFYRADAGFTVIAGQTLTNSTVNKQLFSRCFTGTGNFNTSVNWNNAVAPTDATYHVVPSSGGNNISIGGYNTGGTISPGICTLTDHNIINDLTIKSTSTLTIDPAKQLTVNGTLYIDNSAFTALTLRSTAAGTGSLIHSTEGINGTVERYIAGWTGSPNPENHGWHFLGSPVAAQPISVFHTAGSGNDFYKWVETNPNQEKWVNRTAIGGGLNGGFETNFALGTTGYLIANSTTTTLPFTGNLNVSDIQVTGLTNSAGSSYGGWHLLANPFSSAVKFNQGSWNKTNIATYAQIWVESSASYKVMAGNQIIPATNGFMVYTDGNGSLTIPANSRVHSDSTWYKEETSDERILLLARDSGGKTSQETIVAFNSDATEHFDMLYDSYFMAGFAPSFYSFNNSGYFALNTLPELRSDLVIPLGFVKNNAANFSIQLIETIPGLTIYLKDLKINQDHDLTKNQAYQFISADGDDAYRFQLHFATVGINKTSPDKGAGIFALNKTIYIKSKTSQGLTGNVMVYNMIGQVMVNQSLSDEPVTTISTNSGTGYYLVRVITAGQTVTAKIFLK